MTVYSVADARNNLPQLIDRALEGEEVIISRHGKPLVELRPTGVAAQAPNRGTHQWLIARRAPPLADGRTSVELLNLIYDEPED